MAPKLRPPLFVALMEGGRPPLAAGCGMGEGECAGDVTRGLDAGVGRDALLGAKGALPCDSAP